MLKEATPEVTVTKNQKTNLKKMSNHQRALLAPENQHMMMDEHPSFILSTNYQYNEDDKSMTVADFLRKQVALKVNYHPINTSIINPNSNNNLHRMMK